MEHAQEMRTAWGSEDVQYLLLNFIEEKNKQKIVGYRVTDKSMWEEVLSKNGCFHAGLSVSAIQNKWKLLRKEYKAITILRNEGGFYGTQRLELLKAQMMAGGILWRRNTKKPNGLGTADVHTSSFWIGCGKIQQKKKRLELRLECMVQMMRERSSWRLQPAIATLFEGTGSLGGLLRPPSKWAPIVCPLRHPWTRVRGSDVGAAASHRSTGKAPMIDEEMMNEQMFEYWAEKQRRCQSSFTAADVDVPIGDFVAALEAVEPKLSQEQFNRAYIQLGTNKYLSRAFIALTADRRRDFAWGCGKPL
ncbi:hypothetical protein CJ030_MR8G000564 [Morella rubra]|uniref:Myb/SANT-like domain-containing protein n=1 Tax=Morella rubra TaxID=262757 RepID=A0A6A1USN2_9ROSI|nr:hypothetical protein CJ030_MR8G000564 [Morella rubra]